MKNALLFGASGFIGSMLLEELLNSTQYLLVTAVVRRPLAISHPKLKTLIGDYNSLPSLKDKLKPDDVFIALGTTKKNTPDEKLYYQVDHDYPVLAAKLAKENGATNVLLVSAVGPNINSKIFYIRTKGETERDVIALEYNHTHIFRPSMLMGDRKNEKRPMEKFLIGLFAVINPLFIGNLRKFRGIQGRDVAKAMVSAAGRTPTLKVNVYEWKEMEELVKNAETI
jgi:uncharacterized protein YbjT (DUF2867 family)